METKYLALLAVLRAWIKNWHRTGTHDGMVDDLRQRLVGIGIDPDGDDEPKLETAANEDFAIGEEWVLFSGSDGQVRSVFVKRGPVYFVPEVSVTDPRVRGTRLVAGIGIKLRGPFCLRGSAGARIVCR